LLIWRAWLWRNAQNLSISRARLRAPFYMSRAGQVQKAVQTTKQHRPASHQPGWGICRQPVTPLMYLPVMGSPDHGVYAWAVRRQFHLRRLLIGCSRFYLLIYIEMVVAPDYLVSKLNCICIYDRVSFKLEPTGRISSGLLFVNSV